MPPTPDSGPPSGSKADSQIAYSAEEALAMDRWLIEERGFTLEGLMAEAGLRLAEAILELCKAHRLTRVLFLVGPGNNGGDALVAHGVLESGFEREIWRPLHETKTPVLDSETLVVDGLFGVGLARGIEGEARRAVEHVKSSPARVLGVDVPSGLSATTGEVVGSAGVAIVAHETLTFVGPKKGFFIGDGPAYVGRWRAVEIGFPAQEAETWLEAWRRDRC
jgi:ADP-dependent NAD(P)H-hydrate dehydratase / NAD(P)H-hydrate epimerase